MSTNHNQPRRIGIVQDGPVAFDGRDYWNQHAMASYLQRLSRKCGPIDIYANVLRPGHPGYEPFCEMKLDETWASVHPLPAIGSGSLFKALWRQLRLLPFFRAELKRNDLVFFFLPATFAYWGILIRRIQGKPYVLYYGSDWDETSSFHFRWGRFSRLLIYRVYAKTVQLMERFANKGAAFIVTAGDALREKVARSGVPTYSTVPRMNLTLADSFFREDTCQGETITCLFVGSLIPRKGIDCLIGAFSELRRKGYRVLLKLVGTGPLEQSIVQRLQNEGLFEFTEMAGHVQFGPALWQHYRSSDIFVLPTYSEGFPRVLYEAMSQSVPIVTTPVSGIPYLMKDQVNALLVPPGDVAALADAMEKLIVDGDLRRELIAAGWRTVRPLLEADPGEQLRDLIFAHCS